MNIASQGEAAAPAAALELVVAVAENDVIGRGNQLPWHLPADLRHFKSLTLGKPVLMGRKTYESIGKALPGRTNIVLSRSAEFSPGDCVVVKSLDEARIAAGAAAGAGSALMVIGAARSGTHRRVNGTKPTIEMRMPTALSRSNGRDLAASIDGILPRQLRGASLARISRSARSKSMSLRVETAPAVNSAKSSACTAPRSSAVW